MSQCQLNPAEQILTAKKAVCVIGAGPSGLAVLKVVSQTPQHQAGLWKLVAYEARHNVGGIWLPSPPTDHPPLTPLYDSLTTNVPHPVMSYTDFLFPPSTPVFPNASVVQTYLESYATKFNLYPLIQLNTSVENVCWNGSKWTVRLSTGETSDFDLVIVANGHYRVPRFPTMPGLSDWIATKIASHSAYYRHPRDVGDVVLVLGNGPSGQDISAEICSTGKTVIRSITGETPHDSDNLKIRGRVKEFKPHGRAIFEDGTIEVNIDHCILATGYETAFPFLSDDVIQTAMPAPCPPLPTELYNSRYHVFPLARSIFPLQTRFPLHTLAFVGLPVRVLPFPLVEAQTHAIVQAFTHPDSICVTQEATDILTRYEKLRAEVGDAPMSIAKRWHLFQDCDQFDYRDQLYKFSGIDWSVPDWVREAYKHADALRKVWRALEESGEAEAWVKGVGEGGEHEWACLLKRMLERVEIEQEWVVVPSASSLPRGSKLGTSESASFPLPDFFEGWHI